MGIWGLRPQRVQGRALAFLLPEKHCNPAFGVRRSSGLRIW